MGIPFQHLGQQLYKKAFGLPDLGVRGQMDFYAGITLLVHRLIVVDNFSLVPRQYAITASEGKTPYINSVFVVSEAVDFGCEGRDWS